MMTQTTAYAKLKALIGNLEGRMDEIDQARLTSKEISDLDKKIEATWDIWCRRNAPRNSQ